MTGTKRASTGEEPPVEAEGYGRAGAHFGEILQGTFRIGGEVRRALVTLPLPGLFSSRATFSLRGDEELAVVHPDGSRRAFSKVRRAAVESLSRWAGEGFGGRLTLSGDVPRGRGMGSSTSEVVAAIRAVADALGVRPTAEEVALLASRSETASDPLMLDDGPDGLTPRSVLFDQRRGEVLMGLGGSLPALEVVGVDAGGAGVSTDDLEAPEYTACEVARFGGSLALLEEGVRRGDARMVGRVAAASARINQAYLPKPGFEEFVRLGGEYGSVGVSVAHSGTVMGMLFDPSEDGVKARMEGAANRLDGVGYGVLRFRTYG